MFDNTTGHRNRLNSQPHLAGKVSGNGPNPPDENEEACAAFGYLRGLHERANAVEFRLKNGNSVWFPYNWLGNWKFDPSVGLLLKFSGDLVYLILIRGTNLDRPIEDSGIDLIRAGLQRHRVVWVREMSDDGIQGTAEDGPTVDCIEIAEFESHDTLKQWLGQNAPSFIQ